MKFLLFFCFLFCGILHASSQEIFTDPSMKDLLFNKEVISSNNISLAVLKISYKYDQEIINPSDDEIYYTFDKNGNIKDRILINPFKKRRDSVVSIYYRNQQGQVTTRVEHDHSFTTVELLKYNQDKVIKKESYQMKRDMNWNESIYPEKLMWSDSIFYGESQIEIYNRFGTKYRIHKILKNKNKMPTEIKTYNRSGKLERTVSIDYSGDLIISIREVNDNKLMYNWHKEFAYDKYGLTEEKYYKEGELQYIRKVSYNELGLPELDLKRNEDTGKMSIYKITYFK